MRRVCVCVLLHTLTRKMSVHSFRIRSTQGNSSNIMECEISLKKPRTNFPMTRTTETYKPMILAQKERGQRSNRTHSNKGTVHFNT